MAQDDYHEEEERLPEEADAEEPAEEAAPEETATRALEDALKTSFFFLKVAIIIMLLAYLLKGVFSVHPSQLCFKLSFGRLVPVDNKWVIRPGSGLHFRWPWEEKVDVYTGEKVLELSEQFWTGNPKTGQVLVRPKLDMREDGYVLTGDVNIIHLKLRTRYKVSSDLEGALAYGFGVKKPEEILRRCLQAATCKVVGTMSAMDVIERKGLFSGIERELRSRLDRFEKEAGVPLGVKVITVEAMEKSGLKNPSEPGNVSRAFTEAQNAASMRNQLEHQGKTVAQEILNDGKAREAEIIATARGYKERLVRNARADAQTLEKLLPIYNQSPAVSTILLDRFYHRALEEVMGYSPGGIVLHKGSDDTQRELRLMLERQAATGARQEEASTAGSIMPKTYRFEKEE